MDATLHIKIDKAAAENLKKIAKYRNSSQGQLVREAINSCYQADFSELPEKQKQALSAYQGGFISIGKLAEIMGMHVLEMRRWLNEREIGQNTMLGDEDALHA